MFGYINVNGRELSKEDRQTYQAFYCGLCRQLQQDYGTASRMLLSYDMTFLELLLTGLYEPKTEEQSFRCPVHPARPRLRLSNEVSSYTAAVNVILAYHNLEDDWKDNHDLTRHAAAGLIRKAYLQTAVRYPRQTRAVEAYMAGLAQMEARREDNIDVVAGLTGEMLGELFAWKQDEWYTELKTLGYYMGKFIYLMDAYEDLEKDEKRGQYNPLHKLHKEHPDDYETLCRLMMTSMMSECAKSFERLPILLNAEILRNILYSGVWARYDYIRQKKQKEKDTRDRKEDQLRRIEDRKTEKLQRMEDRQMKKREQLEEKKRRQQHPGEKNRKQEEA